MVPNIGCQPLKDISVIILFTDTIIRNRVIVIIVEYSDTVKRDIFCFPEIIIVLHICIELQEKLSHPLLNVSEMVMMTMKSLVDIENCIIGGAAYHLHNKVSDGMSL